MENENLNKRIQELQAKYNAKFKEVENETQEESDEIKDSTDGSIGGKFKVKFDFKEEHFALHIPSITVGQKQVKLDLPSVTMKLKKISWSMPKLVMKTRKVGERPEVVCKNKKNSLGITLPECKTRFKPIYADVPETIEVKKEIKIEIPEITMRTEAVYIPDIKIELKRQDFYMHLPQITFEDVEVEVKEESNKLQNKTERKIAFLQNAFAEESKEIITDEINTSFDTQMEELSKQKNKIDSMFKPIIDDFKLKIKQLRNSGAIDEVKNLEKQLYTLVGQYNTATTQIIEAIEAINLEREKAHENL
jgi:hypothetical protein